MATVVTPPNTFLPRGHTMPLDFEKRAAIQSDPLKTAESLPCIHVVENAGQFRITIPVGDLDLRKVWVFANSRSISIEIRSRNTMAHYGGCCEEIDEQRILRELKLSQPIKEGCTSVMPLGNNLEITCVKDLDQDDSNWVEMLHFDTRASIGHVRAAPGDAVS